MNRVESYLRKRGWIVRPDGVHAMFSKPEVGPHQEIPLNGATLLDSMVKPQAVLRLLESMLPFYARDESTPIN